MAHFEVKYQAGTYKGTRTVNAEDAEEAKNKVRAMVRKSMTLPMYYESYSANEVEDSDGEDD